MMELLAGEME
jgi:hypothetical protein